MSEYLLTVGETEVTEDALVGRSRVSWSRGVDIQRQGAARAGALSATLRNADLSYNDTVTPLKKGQPVELVGPDSAAAFLGFLERFTHGGAEWSEVLELSALGTLARLTRQPRLSTPLYQHIRTDEALHVLCDVAEVPVELRDFDEGLQPMLWWWLDGADPMAALLELWHTEGPASLIYEDREGRICFRNRVALFTRPRSTEPQATYGYAAAA